MAVGRMAAADSPPFPVLERAEGFVTIEWGPVVVVRVYLPPRLAATLVELRLGDLEELVERLHPQPVLIVGNFNAHSPLWSDSGMNRWDHVLEAWAAGLDLRILNPSPPSRGQRVREWRVLGEAETLFNHNYFEVYLTPTPAPGEYQSAAAPSHREGWPAAAMGR